MELIDTLHRFLVAAGRPTEVSVGRDMYCDVDNLESPE